MKIAWSLLFAHVSAVLGAVFSLMVLIPYPELWAGLPGSNEAFAFAMTYGGPLHIVLGAAAMLALGGATLGWRHTGIFFASAFGISLTMELLGTGTGWPFGAYGYTHGLGPMVLGRVPFVIPLSWFYLGFASYLLASLGLARLGVRHAWGVVALGVWLLMAWDLVLDPAMAHEDVPVKFWVWHERGAYVGMPLVNLVGWIGTGALFMGLARWLWGGPLPADAVPRSYVFAIYAVNVLFGVLLCMSLGLWVPIGLAFVAGLLPAALVYLPRSPVGAPPGYSLGADGVPRDGA